MILYNTIYLNGANKVYNFLGTPPPPKIVPFCKTSPLFVVFFHKKNAENRKLYLFLGIVIFLKSVNFICSGGSLENRIFEKSKGVQPNHNYIPG